jgi:bacterioferritin
MKGNGKVLALLNERLADELSAVNQYIVHAELCENWGFQKLHDVIKRRAIEEMKHAEKLIARIIFLEGRPTVSILRPMHIGDEVEKQHRNDLQAETDAVAAYNQDIRTCVEQGDNGTREMLESILKDEEAHVDWLEAQLDQIRQMGLPAYLSEQLS